jgi:putative acetyltransferase
MSAYIIQEALPKDHPTLLTVWESSVRATHHFLHEDDILFYKTIIPQALTMVTVHILKIDNEILGFIGTQNHALEMLFVKSNCIGRGVGKNLMLFALEKCTIQRLDVNEDNTNALLFYQHFGFDVTSRSPLDGYGKPYPILHLAKKTEFGQ